MPTCQFKALHTSEIDRWHFETVCSGATYVILRNNMHVLLEPKQANLYLQVQQDMKRGYEANLIGG